MFCLFTLCKSTYHIVLLLSNHVNKNSHGYLLLICLDAQHAMNQRGPSGSMNDDHKPSSTTEKTVLLWRSVMVEVENKSDVPVYFCPYLHPVFNQNLP